LAQHKPAKPEAHIEQLCVTLLAETFETVKSLLTLSLAMVQQYIDAIPLMSWRSYEGKLTTISIFPSDPTIYPYC
jgi:hypothetical protein